MIGAVYLKELRESLRDRRALVSMIVIPTFVMPALILVSTKAASVVVTRARSEVPLVMVIHGEDSPGVLAELGRSGKVRLEPASPDWRVQVSDKRVRAAVDIPEGFERALGSGSAPPVTIYDYRGELKSGFAADELRNFFAAVRDRAAARLLAERHVPAGIARPFEISQRNVAPPEKVGGNLIGGVIPYFVIFLCLTGAMYPALDLAAGEKERGTMEVLLTTPADRVDIVLGKFLMVLTGSLSSAAFSVFSLAATVMTIGAAVGGSVDPAGIIGTFALIVPVGVLFSAVLLCVSIFARSFKEAQSYVAPMALVVGMLGIAGVMQGVDLSFALALVPIVNISLASKEMLSGVWHWGYLAAIFGSTALYAAAALALAERMFRREDVVLRA
jgi:sodium transport system permease protein